MDVRVAEEAEVDREEKGKVPPCGDGSGGEAAREVRRLIYFFMNNIFNLKGNCELRTLKNSKVKSLKGSYLKRSKCKPLGNLYIYGKVAKKEVYDSQTWAKILFTYQKGLKNVHKVNTDNSGQISYP